eukprot:9295457-Alexandrium_andersonii.AAC.1
MPASMCEAMPASEMHGYKSWTLYPAVGDLKATIEVLLYKQAFFVKKTTAGQALDAYPSFSWK